MKNKKIIINILLIISLILAVSVYLYIIKENAIKTNNAMLVILLIINILLLIINNMKKKNKKVENIIIIIFIIFSFSFPIYKIGIQYAPTGPNSHLMGVALKQNYINVYGIKIFEK